MSRTFQFVNKFCKVDQECIDKLNSIREPIRIGAVIGTSRVGKSLISSRIALGLQKKFVVTKEDLQQYFETRLAICSFGIKSYY